MIQALDEYKNQFTDHVPVSEDELRQSIADNRGQVPQNIQPAADGSYYRQIVLNPTAVDAANKFQDIIRQYGDFISPQSMRKARGIFDDSVARAGGYNGTSLAEGSMIDAQREAANSIRSQLAKDNPEIVPLNHEINFWLDVQKVAEETAQRQTGQQGGLIAPLAKQVGRATGAAIGYQAGGYMGAGIGGYLGGEVMGKLASTVRSPMWRTVSAVTKNNIADALASGDWSTAKNLLDSASDRNSFNLGTPGMGNLGTVSMTPNKAQNDFTMQAARNYAADPSKGAAYYLRRKK